MKKVGLLLVTTIFLSGCSATNGILNDQDIISAIQEDSKEIIDRQREVSYVPDDVKEFLEKARRANDESTENSNSYLDITLNNAEQMEDSKFLSEVYISEDISNDLGEDSAKIIDILDETIAKGIKLYIDKNMNADIDGSGISTKIGRVWIFINPVEYRENSNTDTTVELERDSGNEFDKNTATIVMQLGDIKDPEYKKVVENLQDEDLIIESIKIGKQQDLIKLRNIESIKNNRYDESSSSGDYQLLMKGNSIDKVRMSISGIEGEEIDDDLQSLTRISNILDFDTEDVKQLEKIKTIIKENKIGKKLLSSDSFNFSYKNLESKIYIYGTSEKINTAEIVIEKSK